MTGNQTASQTIVVVAMGLVAGAAAVALHQHAGLPGPVAATAALSAYLLLLTAHAVMWRRKRHALDRAPSRDCAAAPPRHPQDGMLKAPSPAPGLPQAAPASKAARPPAQDPPPFRADVRPAAPQRSTTKTGAGMQPPPPAPSRQTDRTAPPPLPLPAGRPAESANPARAEDLQDLWSFRPAAEQKLPPFVTGRVPGPSAELSLPGPAPAHDGASPKAAPSQAKAPAPREADVEVIQDAIKRLLAEVNAAEQSRAQPAPAADGADGGKDASRPSAAAGASPDTASIERSIAALRMTAGTMRAIESEGKSTPKTASRAEPASEPPPLPPFVRGAAAAPQAKPQQRPRSNADAHARLMADAISAGRIDVSLEPILGLEDQQTRHYEVAVRLRDADGNPLEAAPGGPDLRGTGLLPLFDGVRVTRTAAVARRLEERGKSGSVFSAFSGESVADEYFLGELAETLHQRASLASQLVLSFTQTDVRAFSTPEWDSLADMRALGFRFALSHLTDLDMDFEMLAEQGFVFAKLDASVFLEGLPAPSGSIPSSDVCRHLARHGLTLVVERIDNEEQLARVFGFGALLGQGQFFGGARPVRADVVSGPRSGRTAA